MRSEGYKIITDNRCTPHIFSFSLCFPFVTHLSASGLCPAHTEREYSNIHLSLSPVRWEMRGQQREETGEEQTRAKYWYKDIRASPECW